MPLYDFHCSACGHAFEALVRASHANQPCPSCGSAQTERCLSKPAAPGRSKALIEAARRQARREGHFSHYSAAERKRAGI